MALVTQSDHDDLREEVAQLRNYVEQLEKRLDGQHQQFADKIVEHVADIYNHLNGDSDSGLLHKVAGDSLIVDADRIEDERFRAEFLSD
jgi:tetrahydromethanopterin S-methyltransferase subunit B